MSDRYYTRLLALADAALDLAQQLLASTDHLLGVLRVWLAKKFRDKK